MATIATEPDSDKVTWQLTGYIVALGIMFGMVVIYGLVFQQFWRWFFMPALGVPAITIWHASGMVLASALFRPLRPEARHSGRAVFDALVLKPIFVFGFGWVIASMLP